MPPSDDSVEATVATNASCFRATGRHEWIRIKYGVIHSNSLKCYLMNCSFASLSTHYIIHYVVKYMFTQTPRLPDSQTHRLTDSQTPRIPETFLCISVYNKKIVEKMYQLTNNKNNVVVCYLTRFAIQAKGPDGKWTRKPLAYRESNNVHLLITRPPEICVNLVFKHIHAASSYTICRQFVPFIYCPL